MKLLRWSVGMLLFAGLNGAAAAHEPDPLEIIKKVDEATKAVKSFSYEARVWDEDKAGKTAPRMQIKFDGQERPGEGRQRRPIPIMRASGKLASADGERSFLVIANEKQVIVLDEKDKEYTIAKYPGGLLSPIPREVLERAFMIEFLHITPFTDEINAESRKYEGTKKIGDTECHVIYVKYRGLPAEARWYFGKDDNLPHRVDRIEPQGGGVRVLELQKLDVSPKFDEATFAFTPPEGYQEKKVETPQPEAPAPEPATPPAPSPPPAAPAAPELLKVGSDAPAWTLSTPDGKSVSLADLKKHVVLLDFWATWCGPCKAAMPGIQKLHEKFKDKPVKVFGVNCWENAGADPAKFMKDNNYTYGLLLKGDEVARAYNVTGIPTFYVIGPDGKITYASSGFNPDEQDELARAIEVALQKIN